MISPSDVLRYMEDRKNGMPQAPDLMDAVDSLRKSPKDYLAVYKSLLEFETPMIQRTTVRQGGEPPELGY